MEGRMKIIGATENGYIIDADANEVANLIGYYSKYTKDFVKPKVGDEIQVDAMFKQLHTLANKKNDLSQTVKTLRNIAELLEPVCPIIEKSIETALEETEGRNE